MSKKYKVGDKIGFWTIEGASERYNGDLQYVCVCACGTEKRVSAVTLWTGTSTHCGCKKRSKETAVQVQVQETRPEIKPASQGLRLIAEGYLPAADVMSNIACEPAWTLNSVARILGVSTDELIQQIELAGKRFDRDLRLG